MSTGVASSLRPENTQNASSWALPVVQNGSTSNGHVSAPSPIASSSSGSLIWQVPVYQSSGQQEQATSVQRPVYVRNQSKSKNRTAEELELVAATSARVASRLAEDHNAVLNPDVDTPFVDELDVVKRLLPYHVFQQPKEDLQTVLDGKGKGKSVDRDLETTEIQETRFAIECHQRLERLRKRWRCVKIREGQRASPSDQGYALAHAVLEADRTETAHLNSELKTARGELERVQKEQRAAANTARMTQFPATQPLATAQTATLQYYRNYPYTYAQPYGNPAAHVTTSTFPVTPTVAPTPTAYAPYQPGGAIPVQLPVASLPALHALGIIPIPATSAPPEGQPQPPAILRGSSANGTMLSLEINVGLLQSGQMTGLAEMLNKLVARNNVNLANAAASTPTTLVATGQHHVPTPSTPTS
ncbi:hypothetical protein FA15DRAFT_638914 [Coprinopsis marcescibilis]|uniref:GLTSCR protein conserved domain-containing protein n=1 Tax=Coprinopsis marcescibilis TaxID=230819 RepID=A0A5C3LBK3_COPMA|nr:hypothetical protein FA15DRAFT_638914 [Coprinopsis marcescibilis]